MVARFGSFRMDTDARRLDRDGTELHLTPKAFDLLALLIQEAPKVVSKADLHARLWPDSFVADTTLVGLVKEIRRVIQQRGTSPVRTFHRVGYAFSAPLDGEPPARSDASKWLARGQTRFALATGRNVIGRDPASEVWLDVSGVSRRHACVVVTPDGVTLEDLGSKNGTMRGAERVTKAIALRDADRIQIAGVVLVFRASSATESTRTRRTRARRNRS